MKRTDEALHRYLDGDLAPEERAEVEAWLDESAEARAAMRELEALGELVRDVAADRSAPAVDLVDGIMARVAADARGSAAARGATSASASASAKKGGVRWLRLAPPLGLALAAAAAFVLYRAPSRVGEPAPPGSVAVSSGVGTAASARLEAPAEAESVAENDPGAQAEPNPGAAIESVDFGAQNGTIFMVAAGPEATPVVWLVDEPEDNRDRMTPL